MGILLNPDNIDFQEALNSEIYVDKTNLLSYTNKVLRTETEVYLRKPSKTFRLNYGGKYADCLLQSWL